MKLAVCLELIMDFWDKFWFWVEITVWYLLVNRLVLLDTLCTVLVDSSWNGFIQPINPTALFPNGILSSADGNYEVTLMTKATVYNSGLVVWQPPAVYKSSCAIDVEFFPYDVQTCVLKLGSWTYDGFKVRIFTYHRLVYLFINLNMSVVVILML